MYIMLPPEGLETLEDVDEKRAIALHAIPPGALKVMALA